MATPPRPASPDQLDAAESVRAAILTGAPDVVENTKWNAPNFVHDGVDRITMRFPPNGGLQLIFHRGVAKRDDVDAFVFNDPTGLLAWPAPDRGVLTMTDARDAADKTTLITDLVRRWIAV